MIEPVDLNDKFALFSEHWRPKIVGELNDSYVKLARLKGQFEWHRHAREEEIYYVLRGHGDMVAGADAAKKEIRHPARAGDAFYFPRNTLIGFYSGGKEGEDHARILAVRWPSPSAQPQAPSDRRGNRR